MQTDAMRTAEEKYTLIIHTITLMGNKLIVKVMMRRHVRLSSGSDVSGESESGGCSGSGDGSSDSDRGYRGGSDGDLWQGQMMMMAAEAHRQTVREASVCWSWEPTMSAALPGSEAAMASAAEAWV